MQYYQRLGLEAAVVGGVLAAAVYVAGTPRTLWDAFYMGAAIHLGFELAGLNAMYCGTGAACLAA